MDVQLIDYTKRAEDILIFTKNTRRMEGSCDLDAIAAMPEEERQETLDYVFKTIQAPLEFVDYSFYITGVTRAFTHQLVRHRLASYAQQAQRVGVEGRAGKGSFDWIATDSAVGDSMYEGTMEWLQEIYAMLIEKGVKPQDARGIIPTNVTTNIAMKLNLRSLGHLMTVRLCERAQGEFQEVARKMRALVLEVHPFARRVLLPHCLKNGMCLFPAFNECRLKAKYPWLNPHPELNQAVDDWEENFTVHNVQPT